MTKVVGVRFRRAGKIYYFDPGKAKMAAGSHVIVETARGIEYGTVLIAPKEVDDKAVVQPLKPVIRVATPEDDKTEQRNKEKEKDVNLQIALCLKAQLQARGVKVILTREGDVCLATDGATNKKVSDMHNRVSLINASGADYMISIHQNSYPEAEISGPQVFYYGSSEMSKKLAEAIQAQLIVDLQPPKEREIKTGNDLYILKNSQCPGVIVECGFLSNPTECENLQNPQYQQAVAAAIARAICKL